MRRARWYAAGLVGGVAAGWILAGRLTPVAAPEATMPASGRAAALALADSLAAREPGGIHPDCHTRVLASPDTTGHAPVVVLLHGFTNCPKQFHRLAEDFSRKGYSVVVPLLPRHGMADRMTLELGLLRGEDLVRAGERAIDVAHGLGRPITVVGLSSSAVVAGWLAQHRSDVDCAVLIAPSFAPRGIPAPIARRVTGALLALPNFYVWWDSKLRADVPGPRQAYPRFASHGLAQVYRLGFTVLADAARDRPRGRKLVLVTTALDEGVNNGIAAELARRWRGWGADVETFEFPESAGVRHDMIDPDQPYQKVELTYPVIERMVASLARP